jgi:hypothetical protein
MINPGKDIFFNKKDLSKELQKISESQTFDNYIFLLEDSQENPESNSSVLQDLYNFLPKDVQEGVLSTFKEAYDAVRERKELIEQLKGLLKKMGVDKIQLREINSSIASNKADIENIKTYLQRDIIDRLKSNILNKPSFSISSCSDIEKRLDEVKAHLWKFRQGTTLLNERLKIFRKGREDDRS